MKHANHHEDASQNASQDPQSQREALLDSERAANKSQPRNFKEDALDDKVVTVAPDGTGPTSTETFDPDADRERGSGNPGSDEKGARAA